MRVFIHTNEKQLIGALVSRYTFERHNPGLTVDLINLHDYPSLNQRNGSNYLRNGELIAWDSEDLQTFTPLRFLPPQLCNYTGKALVVDPDVFCLKPIAADLWDKVNPSSPIAARWIDGGHSHYWASSVMVLQCDGLRHWDFDLSINEMFQLKRDYRAWISLETEAHLKINTLEERYNSFDKINDDTVLLHNTSRATQPWKTGLEIDYLKERKGRKTLKTQIKRIAKKILKPQPTQYYTEHPDETQSSLFFQNLSGAINSNYITADQLKWAIENKYVRQDLMELIK